MLALIDGNICELNITVCDNLGLGSQPFKGVGVAPFPRRLAAPTWRRAVRNRLHVTRSAPSSLLPASVLAICVSPSCGFPLVAMAVPAHGRISVSTATANAPLASYEGTSARARVVFKAARFRAQDKGACAAARLRCLRQPVTTPLFRAG
jgi:hypothetical protein